MRGGSALPRHTPKVPVRQRGSFFFMHADAAADSLRRFSTGTRKGTWDRRRRAPRQTQKGTWPFSVFLSSGVRLTLQIHIGGRFPGGMQKGTWPHPGVPCRVALTGSAQGSLGWGGGVGGGPIRGERAGLGLRRAGGVRVPFEGVFRGGGCRQGAVRPCRGLTSKLNAAAHRHTPDALSGSPAISLSGDKFCRAEALRRLGVLHVSRALAQWPSRSPSRPLFGGIRRPQSLGRGLGTPSRNEARKLGRDAPQGPPLPPRRCRTSIATASSKGRSRCTSGCARSVGRRSCKHSWPLGSRAKHCARVTGTSSWRRMRPSYGHRTPSTAWLSAMRCKPSASPCHDSWLDRQWAHSVRESAASSSWTLRPPCQASQTASRATAPSSRTSTRRLAGSSCLATQTSTVGCSAPLSTCIWTSLRSESLSASGLSARHGCGPLRRTIGRTGSRTIAKPLSNGARCIGFVWRHCHA